MSTRRIRISKAVIVGLAITALSLPSLAIAMQVTIVPAIDDRGTSVEHPEEFSIYLDPFDPAAADLSFPCGKPFTLPAGGFYAWVEGPDQISQRVVIHGPGPGEPSQPHREIRYTVGPAGTVKTSAVFRAPFPKNAEIRLLGLDSHRRDGMYNNEFVRTLSVSESEDGIQMPVGSAIAAVVDPKNGRYMYVSRPVRIGKGRIAAIPFESTGDSTLVVRLERNEPLIEESNDDFALQLLQASGQSATPDVIVPAMARIYAIWYDQGPGTATIELESSKYWFPKAAVSLEDGIVTSYAGTLQAAAALDLTLLLPDELNGQPTSITIANAGEELRALELEPSFPAETTQSGLPRVKVSISAIVGPWEFATETDLSPGDSNHVLAPEAARVYGEVLVGGDPAKATVGFLTNRSSRTEEVAAEFTTDDYGEFTAVVFPEQLQPVALVTVGDREPLWWWIEEIPIRDGDRLEIEIEGQPVNLRIVDATTGEGIAEATVSYGWEGTGGGGRKTNATDEGRVSLPPIPAKELMVFARAPGYRQSQQTIRLESYDQGNEVSIRLERESEEDEITVLLADGSPAVKAEIALVPTEGSPPRTIMTAGDNGRFLFDQGRNDEIFAIRHSHGGTSVGRIGDLAGIREVVLPRAGNTLRVRVIEPSGTPVPYAQITLWMNGLRIQGGFLAWIAGGAGAADRNGEWTIHNISPDPVDILAWQLSEDSEHLQALSNGEMDYRRLTLRPPWNEQKEIEAVLR